MSSELRRDPVTGRWTIIAAERGKRPNDYRLARPSASTAEAEACPFCVGREALTPPEVLAYRPEGSGANAPGWDVRVVPNKFPALEMGLEPGLAVRGMFERMNGVGAHEVIVETPDHATSFAALSNEQIGRVYWACRERVLALKQDPTIEYVIVFKNHGAAAGATREHAHSQLIALPIVPDFVREEVAGALDHFAATNHCVFCDMLRQEREEKSRVIFENDNIVAIAPYASRYPFETWLLPKRHGASFEDAPRPVHDSMAAAVKSVLERMNRALDDPPFNLIVHSAPLREDVAASFHWHMELIPRLSRTAGFEWGTGFYINATAPEEAAAALRAAG
jgi:UDPglucose--hexose-1-phosphate uridylyltransferase